MNQYPPVNLNFPSLWSKHIEKLDTSVFPTCNTIEREWSTTSIKPLRRTRHLMNIHHEDGCTFIILHIKSWSDNIEIEKVVI